MKTHLGDRSSPLMVYKPYVTSMGSPQIALCAREFKEGDSQHAIVEANPTCRICQHVQDAINRGVYASQLTTHINDITRSDVLRQAGDRATPRYFAICGTAFLEGSHEHSIVPSTETAPSCKRCAGIIKSVNAMRSPE